MNSNLGNFPKETTLKRIASCINTQSKMNVVIDKFLDSHKNIYVKYSLLMRLQLFSYNLKQIELPNNVE